MVILNLASFQAGWFACVLGAANDIFWLGPLAVIWIFSLHLYLTENFRREICIGLVFLLVGLILETLMTFLHVYSPAENFFPSPVSPPWLLAMWVNLATIFNVSLRWLHGRYVLATILGSIGGTMAYYGGERIGALSYYHPIGQNLLLTALVWALLVPLLIYAVARINEAVKEV